MRIATSPSKSTLLIATAAFLLVGGAASAQTKPDTENGRYALSPAGDSGVLRLDTRTGTVSTCTNTGAGWACYTVPDERAALDAEIGRLQAENEKLKTQLAERDGTAPGKSEEALPKSDKKGEPKVAGGGGRKIEIPLPSDADMDRAMSFLERAWRRLIEMAQRIQRDAAGGKI